MSIGSHAFEYHLGKEFFVNMESSDIRDANISVKLSVTHNSGIYDLNFKFLGEITLLCDRCLDDMKHPVDTDYHIVVKYGDKYCDDSDEVLEIPESDNYLNVAYMIFDTVSLSIPIKHVHPAGQCNKAMSELLRNHRAKDAELDETSDNYDEETEIDPRWAKLKELSDNN